MERINPYDPPLAESNCMGEVAVAPMGVVTSRFVLMPEHVIDALARYRSQHAGHRLWRWCRWIVSLVCLFLSLGSFWGQQYVASAFMLLSGVFLFFPQKIDDYFVRRNFRKTPHYGTEQIMELSDHGMFSKSEIEEAQLKWAAFSRAVIFDDGVLIFRGPKLVHWVADSTLHSESDRIAIRRLVQAKLPTNYATQQRTPAMG